MILERVGHTTIFDGEKTSMILSKTNPVLTVKGFKDNPVDICNHNVVNADVKKLNQIKMVSKFILSEEIEEAKRVTKKVGLITYGCSLAVVIGVNLSIAARMIGGRK